MNKHSFCEKSIPILATSKRENSAIMYMQDRDPSHFACQTVDNLYAVGIVPVELPAFSLELKLIKKV